MSAQLGSCTALLAVRAVAWEPYSIIPGLQSLIHQDQMLAVPGADMVGLIALLYCCASLPEACQSRYIVVHTHRRNAVLAAVQRSDVISPAIGTALSMSLPICFSLAVQIIQGWCELGAAPANLERTPGIIEQLFAAALRPDSCSAAAECLSTLFSSHKAKTMSHVGLEPLLSVLLQQLQPWLSSFSATPAEELSKEVHVAVCSVCCAAASSALLPTLSGHPQISGLLQLVLEHLLACLTNKHVDVSHGVAHGCCITWPAVPHGCCNTWLAASHARPCHMALYVTWPDGYNGQMGHIVHLTCIMCPCGTCDATQHHMVLVQPGTCTSTHLCTCPVICPPSSFRWSSPCWTSGRTTTWRRCRAACPGPASRL